MDLPNLDLSDRRACFADGVPAETQPGGLYVQPSCEQLPVLRHNERLGAAITAIRCDDPGHAQPLVQQASVHWAPAPMVEALHLLARCFPRLCTHTCAKHVWLIFAQWRP